MRFDYRRATMPIVCSLQYLSLFLEWNHGSLYIFMLVIPGCKPKKHKIWIIHGDQGVGTAEIHHPSCWNISYVNMNPGDRNPDLARRARKIQHQIVPIVAVVTACFTLSFRIIPSSSSSGIFYTLWHENGPNSNTIRYSLEQQSR